MNKWMKVKAMMDVYKEENPEPKDPLSLALKDLKSCSQLLRDAKTELEEALAESEDDYVPETIDPDAEFWEMDTVVLDSILTQLSTAITEDITGKDEDPTLTKELDTIASISKKIQYAVDDISCSVYPPQEVGEIQESFKKLEKFVSELIMLCSASDNFTTSKAKLERVCEIGLSLISTAQASIH